MKIKTSELQAALQSLRPIIGTRLTLPILSCVHIEAKRNRLHITATDLDRWQSCKVGCDGDLEAVCVNFTHLLYSIGIDENTTIKNEGKSLVLKCGQKLAKISVLDAIEFPPLPDSKNDKAQGIACPDLASAIRAVHGFESADEARILTNLHINCHAKMLSCEACDGRNGAIYDNPLICADFEALVPNQFADSLAIALGGKDAVLSASTNSIHVKHEIGFYWCKQAEGKFPQTKDIFNRESKPLGELETKSMIQEIESCLPFQDNTKTPIMKVEFSVDGITTFFVGKGSDLKNHFAGAFKPHTARVNANSFLKCLKAFADGKCNVSSDDNRLVFTSGNLKIVSMNIARGL